MPEALLPEKEAGRLTGEAQGAVLPTPPAVTAGATLLRAEVEIAEESRRLIICGSLL